MTEPVKISEIPNWNRAVGQIVEFLRKVEFFDCWEAPSKVTDMNLWEEVVPIKHNKKNGCFW